MERHNAEKTPQKERMSLRRALKRDAQRQQKIKEVSSLALRGAGDPRNLRVLRSASHVSAPLQAGIEYEYKGLAASIPAKPTKTVFSDDA